MALILDAIALVLLTILQPSLGSALTEAAASGNLTEVEHLLKAGAAVNEADADGEHALGLAVQNGHSAVFYLLIDEAHGLDLNAQNTKHGRSPLTDAAKYSEPKLGHELILKGAALDLQDKGGRTALIEAAYQKNVELGLELVKHGASPDIQDADGYTALILAVRFGQTGLAKELVKQGANLDTQDTGGHTALMWATIKKRLELAKELAKSGANLDLQDDDGRTALMYANLALTKELVKHGANLDTQGSGGRTALMQAVILNHPELAKEMVKRGAILDIQDDNGDTALILAEKSHHLKIVQELVEEGAALDLQDSAGGTALMHAMKHPELGMELLHHGADWRKRYGHGDTVLHLCVRFADDDDVRLVEALLRCGQSVDSRDDAGRTPLWWASHEGKEHMAEVLIKNGSNVVVPALWGQTPEMVANSKELEDLLHKARPSQLGQALLVASSAETWTHLGLGLLVGTAVAATVHFFKTGCACRGHTIEEDEDHALKGATKLAHQAFAKRKKLRFYVVLAHRAATSVAVVVFPLGVAMLLFKPEAMVPFYALVYVAPAAACVTFKQLITSPVLVITGASARGAARAVQGIATAAWLAGLWAAHHECASDIRYAMETYRSSARGFVAHYMVHWGQFSLLNEAAAPLACEGSGLEPFATSTRMGFDAYMLAVAIVASLWVLASLWEAATCKRFQATLPEDSEKIADLAMRISATRSPEEIELLECDTPGVKVVPERRFSVCLTVFLALLDMFVLDYVTIFNLVMSYNTIFAGALLAITVMSTLSEVLSGTFYWLPSDAVEAITRGVMPDRLTEILAVEKGLEAPLSLAITVYAFPFSIRGWFSLCTGLASMALSIYGCAQYLAGPVDMDAAVDAVE